MKWCNGCKTEKPLTEFPNRKDRPSGIKSQCKTCSYKYRRKLRILTDYGITNKQFIELLEKQNNKCLLCKREMKSPYIDHDHKTGKIRGLIHRECNFALGWLEWLIDHKLLEKGIQYFSSFL
jgi:hypothetical protein